MGYKKYLIDKNKCEHPDWRSNGNGQYICKYCGKTTTMSATRMFKILKNIVDLIHGENVNFKIQNYIDEYEDISEAIHAPFLKVIPRQITWKEFKNIKKNLKSSTKSVLIFYLYEYNTPAELVIYEILPDV